MAKAKKKQKKTQKHKGVKIILMPDEDTSEEKEEMEEQDEDESGMYLEKEDVKIIYNALSAYTPTEEEVQRHELLHEEFEEVLVVDYNEKLPGIDLETYED